MSQLDNQKIGFAIKQKKNEQFDFKLEANRIIEDNIIIEVQINSVEDDKKENQPTAETSNNNIKNFDCELYDPEDMKKLELVNVIENQLSVIISILKGDREFKSIQSDGYVASLSSGYKINVLKLLKVISKMEYRTIKDILIDKDTLKLFLVF